MDKYTWYEAAEYSEEVFGSYADYEGEYFNCCECGEPLYKGDFPNHDWKTCPICEYQFIEEEEEL